MLSDQVRRILEMSESDLKNKVDYVIYTLSKRMSLTKNVRSPRKGLQSKRKGKERGVFEIDASHGKDFIYIDEEEDEVEPIEPSTGAGALGKHYNEALREMQGKPDIPYSAGEQNVFKAPDNLDDIRGYLLKYATLLGRHQLKKLRVLFTHILSEMKLNSLDFNPSSLTFKSFCILFDKAFNGRDKRKTFGAVRNDAWDDMRAMITHVNESAFILLLIAVSRGFNKNITKETKEGKMREFNGSETVSSKLFDQLKNDVDVQFSEVSDETMDFIREHSKDQPESKTNALTKEQLDALNEHRTNIGKDKLESEIDDKGFYNVELDDDDKGFIQSFIQRKNEEEENLEADLPDAELEQQNEALPDAELEQQVEQQNEALPDAELEQQAEQQNEALPEPNKENLLTKQEAYILNGRRAEKGKDVAPTHNNGDGTYTVHLDEEDAAWLARYRKRRNMQPIKARFDENLLNSGIPLVIDSFVTALNEMNMTLGGAISVGDGNISKDIIDKLPQYKQELEYIHAHLFGQNNDILRAISMGQRVFETSDGIITDVTVFYSTGGISIGNLITLYRDVAQLFNRIVTSTNSKVGTVPTDVNPNYLFTISQNGRLVGSLQGFQQGGTSISERQTLYSVERRRLMNELVSKGLLKVEHSKELVDPNTGLPLFDQFGQKVYENSYSYLGVPVSEKDVNDMINNFLMRKFLNQSRSFFSQIDLEQLRLKNLKKKTIEQFKRDVKMRGVTSQPKPVNNQDIYRGTASQGMRLNPNISIYRR